MHWGKRKDKEIISEVHVKNLSAFCHYLSFEFWKKNDNKQTWKNANYSSESSILTNMTLFLIKIIDVLSWHHNEFADIQYLSGEL